MNVSEQIIELINKVEALNDKINLVDGTVQFQMALNWTIIIGVISISGLALYFISKSIIQTGVEKGINKVLDYNKLKLDKKNPEIIGTLKLNSSEDDTTNIRLVKFKDEPTINIESDKNNSIIKVNHKEIIVEDFETLTPTLFNGCRGKAKYNIIHHGKNKIIEIILNEIEFGAVGKHAFFGLPKGYRPCVSICFNGSDEQNSNYIFSINTKGEVIINNPGNLSHKVSAYVVFIAHEEIIE